MCIQRIPIENHTNEHGKIDWAKYDKAKTLNGELCTLCGDSLLNVSGRPSICGSCQAFTDNTGEVKHSGLIRCPGDGHLISPDDDWVYDEGNHNIVCPECKTQFTVETEVSYVFTSPPRRVSEES